MNKKLKFQAAALALLVAAGAAACTDDDKTTSATNTNATPASADQASYCEPAIAFSSTMANAPMGDAPPEALTEFVSSELLPAAEALDTSATDDLKPQTQELTTAVTQLAAGGDPSVLGSPTVADAQSAIGRAVHENCDAEQVEITAVEYAFEGVPQTLPAGLASFALTNEGVEEHEMVVFKRNEGVNEDLEQIMQLPEEQQMEKLTFTGVTFGGPGSTSYAAVDLEPGTYFLVCFVPVGGGEDGPPHFMEGMQHTITVA